MLSVPGAAPTYRVGVRVAAHRLLIIVALLAQLVIGHDNAGDHLLAGPGQATAATPAVDADGHPQSGEHHHRADADCPAAATTPTTCVVGTGDEGTLSRIVDTGPRTAIWIGDRRTALRRQPGTRAVLCVSRI